MKKNDGFTFLEIALVITVVGILAALAVVKFGSIIADTTLEKAANNLYTELRGLSSLCYKNDEMIMVTFSNDFEQCNIYVDGYMGGDKDSTIQESELYKTHKLPSPVTFGISQPPPDSWKFGYEPQNGLANDWQTVLFVAPNPRHQYSLGGVYLTIPRLPKTAYFIGITTDMQSIKFYKWNSSSWIEL